MFDKKYLYEFDPSGGLAANRITDELHIINPASGSDFDVIIPSFAPFFKKGLVVKHLTSGQTLTEGVHFDLGYHFAAASKECATPIYGAIVLTDRTLSGSLSIDYQTLGGEWVLDTQEIQTILANIKTDPRTVKWDDVIDKPITFPPVDHLHHSDDLVGMDDVVKGINDIRDAIGDSAAKAMTALLEHIRDHANPHVVSLAQLGLDDLGGLSEATETEVDQGTDGLHFVSSRRLAYWFGRKVQPAVDAHAKRTDNPHGVTKTQVGLGDVANFRMATLAEALEGSLSNRYMSPQLTEALVRDRIEAALSGTGQTVTKESIGLGLVENYPPSTFEQAIAGTHETSVMTPLRVAQHVSNAVAAAIQAHLDADNPHKITAKTVHLENVMNYGVATAQELTEGTANNKYVTVAGVSAMIGAGGAGVAKQLEDHIANKNNPHGVTKAHVGLDKVQNYPMANTAQVVAGNSTTYLSPAAMLGALWQRLADRVMANASEGDIGFVNGDGSTGGMDYARLVSRELGIATNAAELAALKNTTEDFGRVFRNWRRISLLDTLVTPAVPDELDAWKFDEPKNAIICQVNSKSLVGFVSPGSYLDYTFEVNVTSSDADDDLIGILLATYVDGGKTHTLTALRSCGGDGSGLKGSEAGNRPRSLWYVVKDFGTSEARYIYEGNGGLKWPDTGTVDDSRHPTEDVGSMANKGWGAWLKGVKIRAVRHDSTITVQTTDFDGDAYVAGSLVTIDLTAHDDLAGFLGKCPIGYVAFSQDKATWKTLTRPDASRPIYDITTGQVITYDGNTWNVVETPEDYMRPGRIYHTELTGKTHFVDEGDDIFLIADLKPQTNAKVASTPTIKLSGNGSDASPLKAELTGVTPDSFHSDVDLTAGK